MIRSTYARAARIAAAALALCAAAGAQTTRDTASAADPPDKRNTVGFRLRGFPIGPLSQLGDKEEHVTGSIDWMSNTTSRCPSVSFGVMDEFKLSEKVTLTGEILFQRFRYTRVADTWWGTDDSSTTADERYHSIRREATKASFWDLPLLAHFEAFQVGRLPSKLWLAAGMTARAVSSVESTHEYLSEDGETTTDELRTLPNKRFLLGATVGVGFRFLDDYRTRVTPEIRYTRWLGRTFSSETTRTPVNQLEFGVGITF